MYNTVDSISSQLVILHMPGVIYMPSRNGPAIPPRPGPSWNGPEHIYACATASIMEPNYMGR